MQQLTDEEVMLKYKQGLGEAMDELVRRYKNPLYHFAYRISQDALLAEDSVQEVFLRVHEARHIYIPSGKFSTWIFSICHNLMISQLRKKKWCLPWPTKNDESGELVEFASPDPSPRDVVENKEMVEILKNCIQGLSFLQKEALILREFHSLDYKEIAVILNKPLSTVKTLIHRARAALKDKMLVYLQEDGHV
jgi:RNA polymerase sigma-70 factor (ECF subfamily)